MTVLSLSCISIVFRKYMLNILLTETKRKWCFDKIH